MNHAGYSGLWALTIGHSGSRHGSEWANLVELLFTHHRCSTPFKFYSALSVLIAMALTVPLCGVVAWLDLCGKKKQGLAIGLLCSVGIWLCVIGVGV